MFWSFRSAIMLRKIILIRYARGYLLGTPHLWKSRVIFTKNLLVKSGPPKRWSVKRIPLALL